MDNTSPIKTLELDKICRVCLTVKKDMRPLFGEMVSEMLMECTRIQVSGDAKWEQLRRWLLGGCTGQWWKSEMPLF